MDLKIKAYTAVGTSVTCLVATICFRDLAFLLGVVWPLVALLEARRARAWEATTQQAIKLVNQYQWLLDRHVNEDAGEAWKQGDASDEQRF